MTDVDISRFSWGYPGPRWRSLCPEGSAALTAATGSVDETGAMNRIERVGTRTAVTRWRAAGDGFSFVELLVTIVLIGTVVIATLVGLRATIVANTVNDDRAHMDAWLQEGVDTLHRAGFVSCSSGMAAVTSAYQTTLDGVSAPTGWAGGSLQLTDVKFASVDPARHVELWGTSCDTERPSQLLTVRVTAPDGMSEIVRMVRDG